MSFSLPMERKACLLSFVYLYYLLRLLICVIELVSHPWNEISLVMMYDIAIFLNLVYRCFVKNFCICIYHGIGFWLPSLAIYLFGFGICLILPSKSKFHCVPFLSILWNDWKVSVLYYLQTVLWSSAVNPSALGFKNVLYVWVFCLLICV